MTQPLEEALLQHRGPRGAIPDDQLARPGRLLHGLDSRLDKQLRIIQELPREIRDEKLAAALTHLSDVVASLEDTQTGGKKQRRSDPIMLMLELLPNIHFDAAQRRQLKEICSELSVYSRLAEFGGSLRDNGQSV